MTTTGKRVDIELTTLGKAFVIFILLLVLSFVIGLYLGREAGKRVSTPLDDASRDEQVSACNYKVQDLTTRLTALTAAAKEAGLMDGQGSVARGVRCAVPEKGTVPAVAAIPEKEKEKKDEAKEGVKPIGPGNSSPGETAAAKVPPVVPEKTAPAACKFSLQIYASKSKEEALAVQKRSKIQPLRLVEAEIDGAVWYRLRYGCFAEKGTAEAEIEGLMKQGARPYLAKE
ncbi:MAG TPA: SPOR domain-containing protein [bacterium]|nr:SPOR domain-containing protein [bacterium]